MNNVNINISGVEILDTGTIIQFNKNLVEFNFDFPNFPLKIILDFQNKPFSETLVKPSIIDNHTIKLNFINYNNSLGTGNTKPLNIATYQGKILYMNYRIYALDDSSDKTIHYSFYLSEEKL